MSLDPVRLAILGAAGRMGRTLSQCAARERGVTVGAAIERAGAPQAGEDAAQLAGLAPGGVCIGTDLAACATQFDVAIDFTRPEATLAAVAACCATGKAMVIGTTGFTIEQKAAIDAASRSIPICMAGNFSIGINLCVALVEQAARILGPGFDVEIVEAHHRHKVDAPSGTALMLGEAAARGSGRCLADDAVYARHGQVGARRPGTIGFAAVRGGDVVGDHSVLLLGEGERIEISHRASSRENFARGALRAAAWLRGRAPGLYGMKDVLA